MRRLFYQIYMITRLDRICLVGSSNPRFFGTSLVVRPEDHLSPSVCHPLIVIAQLLSYLSVLELIGNLSTKFV